MTTRKRKAYYSLRIIFQDLAQKCFLKIFSFKKEKIHVSFFSSSIHKFSRYLSSVNVFSINVILIIFCKLDVRSNSHILFNPFEKKSYFYRSSQIEIHFILYCMGVGLGGGCQTFYEFGIVSEKIIRNQRKKPDKTYSSLSAFAVQCDPCSCQKHCFFHCDSCQNSTFVLCYHLFYCCLPSTSTCI